MRQRVMIAMGLSCNPQLLIADEPTTALDVTIQAQIIDLVKRLRDEIGMAIIWITHDLGVVAGLADRVIVMYAGFIVEEASVKELYGNPRIPTRSACWAPCHASMTQRSHRLTSIEGLPPDLIDLPKGCPFHARCQYRIDRCQTETARVGAGRARTSGSPAGLTSPRARQRQWVRRGGGTMSGANAGEAGRNQEPEDVVPDLPGHLAAARGRCEGRRCASTFTSITGRRWGWWASRAAASPRPAAPSCSSTGPRRARCSSRARTWSSSRAMSCAPCGGRCR